MSRSRRKHSIAGNTHAESEKKDKRLCNRMLRRSQKCKYHNAINDIDLLADRREIYNVCCLGDKDGKCWFDPAEHPNLMRK